jgi:hypothetical protein
MVPHNRLAAVMDAHTCCASHKRLYVWVFLKPAISATLVPSMKITFHGTVSQCRPPA